MIVPLPICRFVMNMSSALRIAAALATALVASSALMAAEDAEEAAARLQAATLTIRIVPSLPKVPGEGEPAEAPAAEPAQGPQRVIVCSGVSIGEGLVVTHFDSSTQGRIRLTLPGGAQAEGRLKAYDQHTGLALLETTQRDLPALAAPPEGENSLRVGGTVLSAAAWGTEKPVVAVGHVGGLDRSLPGTSLPPLLQCGLRATETSTGGPVVDGRGRLVGIVVAADPAADARGWVYAIPVEHVARLRRAVSPGKVVIIPKVRPVVGLRLTAGTDPGSVIVEQIEKSGPADKAGIAVGDRVLAVDGLIVRSVYQVTTPVLQKRPGDKISLMIERGGVQQKTEIQLGGSFAVKEQLSSDTIQIADLTNLRVDIRRGADGRFDIDRRPQMRDLAVPAEGPAAAPANKTDLETQLFERALERYGKLILRLQEQVKERDDQRAADAKQIEALKAELERLKTSAKPAR